VFAGRLQTSDFHVSHRSVEPCPTSSDRSSTVAIRFTAAHLHADRIHHIVINIITVTMIVYEGKNVVDGGKV
jgi:hypothetical protein